MSDDELMRQAVEDLIALENDGAAMPFVFRPSEAFYLLSALQLALRHPAAADDRGAFLFARALAEDIAKRIGQTPALTEMARRGFDRQHDTARGETAAAAPDRKTGEPLASEAAKPKRRAGRGR